MSAVMDRPDGFEHDHSLSPQEDAQQVAARAAELVNQTALFQTAWPDKRDQQTMLKRFKFARWLIDTGRLTELV
jgi:hypothetical protein